MTVHTGAIRQNVCGGDAIVCRVSLAACLLWRTLQRATTSQSNARRTCQRRGRRARRSNRPSRAPSPTASSSSTRPARCCRAPPPAGRRRPSPGSGRTPAGCWTVCPGSSSRSATGRCTSGRSPTPRTTRLSTRPSVSAVGRRTTSARSSASWSESEPVSSH